jgi:hypothetical protein
MQNGPYGSTRLIPWITSALGCPWSVAGPATAVHPVTASATAPALHIGYRTAAIALITSGVPGHAFVTSAAPGHAIVVSAAPISAIRGVHAVPGTTGGYSGASAGGAGDVASTRCLLSTEIDELRGFIGELHRVSNFLGYTCGAEWYTFPVIMTLVYVVSRQPVSGKLFNERGEVLARLLRYIVSIPAQGREYVIDRVLPVKKLPHIDAGGVQAKTMTAIGVEENGPVVELFPEHDERIGDRFFIVLHGSTVPVPLGISQTEHYLIEGA